MTDRRIYLTVVLILGGALLACVVAISVLAGLGKGIPDILQNLAVGSLTGLAGLLSKGPSDEPQDVNVVNRRNEPVPVDPA